jgi:anti-sigma factor RsiW
MSDTFQCGDNAALVSYLYDECDPAERSAIEAHIALCAACAAEVAALGSARLHLASWAPPDADLGFQIVRPHPSTDARGALSEVEGQAPGPRPQKVFTGPWAWFRQPMPAWAQAVAACLIFGAGLSLGVIRGTTPTDSPTPDIPAAATTESTVTATDLAALERRMRVEIASLRATPVSATGASPQFVNSAQLMAEVRALIDESEQRQQRELALRTLQLFRDFDSQRKIDLAAIERNFGQIEGLTGAEVREQREMLNYLMRVSQQQ